MDTVSLILAKNPHANIRQQILDDLTDAAKRAGFDPAEILALACLHTNWNPFMWGMGMTGYPTQGSLLRVQSMLRYLRPLRGLSLVTLKELHAPPGTGYKTVSGADIAAVLSELQNGTGPVTEPTPVHPRPNPIPTPIPAPLPPDALPPTPPAQPPRKSSWLSPVLRVIRLIDSKPVWFVLGLAVPAPVIHTLDVALDAVVLFLQTIIP